MNVSAAVNDDPEIAVGSEQPIKRHSVAMTTPAVTVAVVWCLFKTR